MANLQITVDDGPKPQSALEKILEIIDERKVKAAFFVLGKQIATCRGGIDMIKAKGHVIGNHSWSHLEQFRDQKYFTETEKARTKKLILDDFVKAHNEIRKIGYGAKHWRAPRGDPRVIELIETDLMKKLGYFTNTIWHLDSEDWKTSSREQMLKNIHRDFKRWKGRKNLRLLFHVKPTTVSALPEILNTLEKENHRIVDFSQTT